MKYVEMIERRVHVCRRAVAVPDDFDPQDADHKELLDRYYDGEDWMSEEIVDGELIVDPLTTSDGESISDFDELTWEDLNDD